MAMHADQLVGWSPSRTQVPRLAAHLHDWLSSLMQKVKHEESCVASPPLVAGERVLLSVCDANGRSVVATGRALYHQNHVFPRAADDKDWVRLPWELVGRVTWRPDRQTLTVAGLVPTIPGMVLSIRDGARTALLARERIEWTSLIQTRVDLGEHGSLRVLARRSPGDEDLVWVVALEEGIDPKAPGVEAAVHAALARLHADAGLPSSPRPIRMT